VIPFEDRSGSANMLGLPVDAGVLLVSRGLGADLVLRLRRTGDALLNLADRLAEDPQALAELERLVNAPPRGTDDAG